MITKEVTNIADTLETQTGEIKQINEGIEQINDVEMCIRDSRIAVREEKLIYRNMIPGYKVIEYL